MHGAATFNIYLVQMYLYLAKLNPVLHIGDIAQFVERFDDDLKTAGSSPLCAPIFLSTKFVCWHTSLQLETLSQND